MALDWKKALKPVSESKEFKPNAGGAALSPAERAAKGMEIALAAYKAGNKNVKGEALKRPTIVKKGDEVKFSVRYANSPVKLVGEEREAVVPAKDFEAIYGAIKESLLAGEFNSQLLALSETVKKRGTAGGATRKAKAAK